MIQLTKRSMKGWFHSTSYSRRRSCYRSLFRVELCRKFE